MKKIWRWVRKHPAWTFLIVLPSICLVTGWSAVMELSGILTFWYLMYWIFLKQGGLIKRRRRIRESDEGYSGRV